MTIGRLATISIVDANGVEQRLDFNGAHQELPKALVEGAFDDKHPQCRCDPRPIVADMRPDFWPDEMQARRRVRHRERKAAKVRP